MEFAGLKLQKCRHGWMLCSGPFIGKALEHYGEYSEGEVDRMRAYLRPGDTVVDVGANIGALTLPLAGMVGATGTVHSFESEPGTFNLLCAHLALNDVRNVRPYYAFVSNDPNPKIASSSMWGSYVTDRWPTPLIALDDVELEACALIKIDVDGGELGVLKSARRLIERSRPVLYFENDIPSESPALLEYVFDLNYDVYWDPQQVVREGNFFGKADNIWSPKLYISKMMLALPGEKRLPSPEDRPAVEDPKDYWSSLGIME